MARVQIQRMPAVAVGTMVGVDFTMVGLKSGDFSVTAKVKYQDGSGPVVTHDVADAGGKIKVFKDVDDFIKQAAKARVLDSATGGNVPMRVTNYSAIEPQPYTGDLIARAQRELAGINKQRTSAAGTITRLTQEIALFPANPTAGEAALKAEKQAQKVSVEELDAWLAAEQTRLNGILNP
ncbi:MAG: hypothetical protein N2483_10245 [Burkholderiaceae bacterium]|nr:hypothetical protein [Burkholderiaceae bacterium]